MMSFLRRSTPLLVSILTVLLAGCGDKPAGTSTGAAAGPGLKQVSLQTDWYAQGEHGGFYQASVKGFYKDVGLEADIIPGGPGTYGLQVVATERVTFGISRSDDVMKAINEGVPLVIVAAYMQHDPQGILLHEENPISTFQELDGKTIMTAPGALWLSLVEARYNIKVKVIPLAFSLAQFMADKTFMQQCFVTNEPFYARKNGARPKTILLSDSGYDPYRVIFTSQSFARKNPEVVRSFVAASIKGWGDYIDGDPKAANDLILSRNKDMSQELLDFSRSELKRLGIVEGRPDSGNANGLLTRKRLREQIDIMAQFKMIPAPIDLDKVARFDFLPADLQARTGP